MRLKSLCPVFLLLALTGACSFGPPREDEGLVLSMRNAAVPRTLDGSMIDPLAQEQGEPSVFGRLPSPLILSVVYFEDRAGRPDLRWLRKGMADLLIARLTKDPHLVVVQRERMEEVIREQVFQLTGRVGDDSTVNIGRLLGATVLVTGSFQAVQGQLTLRAQLVGVEDGAIVAAVQAKGPMEQAPSLAQTLVHKVATLVAASTPTPSPVLRMEEGKAARDAVGANDSGVRLSREANMFEALRAYEQALAANPHYPPAASNFKDLIQTLTGRELLELDHGDLPPPPEWTVLHRLSTKLLDVGMEVTLGKPAYDFAQRDQMTLRVPVRITLSDSAIQAVRDVARSLGGRVQEEEGPTSSVMILLSKHDPITEAFARAIQEPRRVFLRLVDHRGLTLGLFSELQGWRLDAWLTSSDGRWVRITQHKTLTSWVRFPSLSREQATRIAGVEVIVASVAGEKASVRVEVREPEKALGAPARDPLDFSRSLRTTPSGSAPRQNPFSHYNLEGLEGGLRERWNPLVSEHPWAVGYLPGNRRRTVIGCQVHRTGPLPSWVIAGSGDENFDDMALQTSMEELTQWWKNLPHEAIRSGFWPLNLRVQYQLVKDLPPLNLITAQKHLIPLQDFQFSRTH